MTTFYYGTRAIIRKYRCYFILWSFALISICILCFLSVQIPDGTVQRITTSAASHTLCLIVPFRNRLEELLEFVPHMSTFLGNQNVNFHISVINQIDEYRFNRGSLINVGFLVSTSTFTDCDYVAMHDVDLLPLNNEISYKYPGERASHIAAPHLHPKYHYKTYIGGILLMSNHQFILVNGLSNKYWGWGLEDDEFFLRLKEKNVKILRPGKLSTNYTNTFKHIHGPNRKRDMDKCFNQTAASIRRDRRTGLNNVSFEVPSVHSIAINGHNVTFVNVILKCDQNLTPWCTCPPDQLDKPMRKNTPTKKV